MMQPGSGAGRRSASDRGRQAAGVQRAKLPPKIRPRNTSAAASEETAAAALTLQFLGFIAEGRTYGETMEAWRSNCPRMPIWENAVRDGLVRIENSGVMTSSRIVLTAKGSAHLRNGTHPASDEV